MAGDGRGGARTRASGADHDRRVAEVTAPSGPRCVVATVARMVGAIAPGVAMLAGRKGPEVRWKARRQANDQSC